MIKEYVPERGDVVWIDFSPTVGHEQGGKRPAHVISPFPYHLKRYRANVSYHNQG